MFLPKPTPSFDKAFKRIVQSPKWKNGEWISVTSDLCQGNVLPQKNRDHALNGKFAGLRECHVCNDVLLIYYVDQTNNTLNLPLPTNTGGGSRAV